MLYYYTVVVLMVLSYFFFESLAFSFIGFLLPGLISKFLIDRSHGLDIKKEKNVFLFLGNLLTYSFLAYIPAFAIKIINMVITKVIPPTFINIIDVCVAIVAALYIAHFKVKSARRVTALAKASGSHNPSILRVLYEDSVSKGKYSWVTITSDTEPTIECVARVYTLHIYSHEPDLALQNVCFYDEATNKYVFCPDHVAFRERCDNIIIEPSTYDDIYFQDDVSTYEANISPNGNCYETKGTESTTSTIIDKNTTPNFPFIIKRDSLSIDFIEDFRYEDVFFTFPDTGVTKSFKRRKRL